MSGEKLSLSRDAFLERPLALSAGHAASTNLCRFFSAFGAGSVATTSKPCARNSAAQLAPMTPVPTIAIRRTGLFNATLFSPCRLTSVSQFRIVFLRYGRGGLLRSYWAARGFSPHPTKRVARGSIQKTMGFFHQAAAAVAL